MTNIYEGHAQPEPNERLAQIKIFLADEDYHRTLEFTKKLAKIENYVRFLERNEHEFVMQLLKQVKGMIFAHTELIKRATQSPSTSYFFTRYNHKNRLLHLVKDRRRRAALARVKAPKLNWNLLPGLALHKCLEEKEKPSTPDPFSYTKKLVVIRRQQDTEARRILNYEQNAVFKKLIPTTFNSPYTLLIRITHEDVLLRKKQLSDTLQKLIDAAKLAPRPFIQEIIAIITHSMQGEMKIDHTRLHESFPSCWKGEDVERLLILAQPSWSSISKHARLDLFDGNGKPKSQVMGQLVKLLESVVWPSPEDVISFADIYQCMNEAVELNGSNFTTTEIEALLQKLNDVEFIRYNTNSRTVQQPILDRHPEDPSNTDSIPLESFRATAKRLGNSMAYLEGVLKFKNGFADVDLNRDTSWIFPLKQQVETRFPLPLTAAALSKTKESLLNKEQAALLLQHQLLLEHHHDWDDRTLRFQNLWSFAFMRKDSMQFFALNRWPPELQSRKRRNEILDSGPRPQSPKQSSSVDAPIPKEHETIYRGEEFFPFGETRYQEALLSREIELGRPGGPVQERLRNDPYALPPIPDTENNALLAYAKTLGLSVRDRKRSADNAFLEEMLSPESPPKFMPETIGGVRILVAEAPPPKRRLAVASSPAQIYRNGGDYEDVEFVKPGKQPDWRQNM